MPNSHKMYAPSLSQLHAYPTLFSAKHPLWSPNGCQFLRQPTADPFRPGNCHLANNLKNPGASIFLSLHEIPVCISFSVWPGSKGWERARVCISNLSASSLLFAPRLKSPLIPPQFVVLNSTLPADSHVPTADFES
ncbi:hypothetical protein AMECASPLE_036128 [Ameca splendens]|uniref:Uncharacterized protein n=1 Tax=Ameca splendens TaxID=208324 RepID=A0ABV0YVY0_9TELE